MRTPLSILAAVSLMACSNQQPARTAAAPAAARAQTPPTLALTAGLGNHDHAIATTSPDAQRHFDKGCDLVFGFNHEEAVRSFKRAALLLNGRADDAERVFGEDLARYPRNARSLLAVPEPNQPRQGRGCCLGYARLRRGKEGRRHYTDD
jgi:hypothetical protein